MDSKNIILNHKFPPVLTEVWDEKFAIQLASTQGAVSGLNQAVPLLLNPELLKQPLLDKEAESSSRLEGTQVSAEDVYRSVLIDDPEKSDDILETVNYKRALEKGIESIKTQSLNQFLIRQLHNELLSGVRGQTKNPGKYRERDVWIGATGTEIGSARYIPPEAIHVPQLMESLEKFISNNSLHPLVACGIIHHRFEAIHPFEDGNGRTGRLIVTLYLLYTSTLDAPMLYPSGYFEKNREAYTNALHSVDMNEDWYSWLIFFLKGLQNQAELSLALARNIDSLFKKYRQKIQDNTAHLSLFRVLEYCFKQPYVNVRLISDRLELPVQTVRRYVNILLDNDILRLYSTVSRNEKIYENHGLLDILRKI